MSSQVEYAVPARKLGKGDIDFQVTSGSKKLGRLKISNGTVIWYSKSQAKAHKMNWADFGDMMTGWRALKKQAAAAKAKPKAKPKATSKAKPEAKKKAVAKRTIKVVATKKATGTPKSARRATRTARTQRAA